MLRFTTRVIHPLPIGDAMALKNIGVFIDATPEAEKRVDYAATLAHQYGAHLAGIHVVSAGRPEH
jgi:nucleotide-binding universal stress UspA family protein